MQCPLYNSLKELPPSCRVLCEDDEIPLYGPSGQPEENDIVMVTPDGFLESAIAAVVRHDPKTITNMLGNRTGNMITLTMYKPNGDQMGIQQEVLTLDARYHRNNSKSSWVAVLQEAYAQLLMSETGADGVHNGFGGSAHDALTAFYGNKFPIVDVDCYPNGHLVAGQMALSKPATFDTRPAWSAEGEKGELTWGNSYTVHAGNSSHLILRNPRGWVNYDGGRNPSSGSKDIQDLGNGVFAASISVISWQCSQYRYIDIPNVVEQARTSFDAVMSAANAAATGPLDPAKAVYTFSSVSKPPDPTTAST
ncbi:hypothetical protein LTR70_010348 [Exophiala xenobiotica]|uniref:Uncharacterized protein n=1 Tax=Lithohypha guttulata TaxID=1690604 RepID=A0ABR0JVM1_9EURO|nr:hypothetical protein LTR24_009979 [Lithohypha guttulata]KAK5309370.1 hypothetical protein LTR70_010348 [Exophiala xenobiotica]